MAESLQLDSLPHRLLTAVEVASLFKISRAFAYQLMQRRKIRTVSFEGARRVRSEDLLALIESSLEPPAFS